MSGALPEHIFFCLFFAAVTTIIISDVFVLCEHLEALVKDQDPIVLCEILTIRIATPVAAFVPFKIVSHMLIWLYIVDPENSGNSHATTKYMAYAMIQVVTFFP